MSPQLTAEEIDDLLYFSRTNEKNELTTQLHALGEREKVSPAEILMAARDEGKSTCLHMATGNGHLDMVTLILESFAARPAHERQAYLDAPNEYGNTGLHWAALGGHLSTVKFLVESGAAPALANDKNYVPLDLASFGGKLDVVDYFLAQSGALESGQDEGLGRAAAGMELERADAADETGKTRMVTQDYMPVHDDLSGPVNRSALACLHSVKHPDNDMAVVEGDGN